MISLGDWEYDNWENDWDEDEELELELERQKQRKKIVLRILAAVILLIFLTYPLANFLRVVNFPVVDLFITSEKLLSDPEISKLQKSVVQLNVMIDNDNVPQVTGDVQGTGFNIREDGMIITNRHVVKEGEHVQISFMDDGVYDGDEMILADNDDLDLAFVNIDGSDLPTVSLDTDYRPRPGDEVIIIGNPRGLPGMAGEGEILELIKPEKLEEPFYQIRADIYPGNSGSPVFSQAGKVIGVIYAAYETEDDEVVGLAIPADYIQRILQRNSIGN